MAIREISPGRDAVSPWTIPFAGWRQLLVRAWTEAGDDNVGLIAAGVAFYGFLALVPLLGAMVLSYGLVADPATVMQNMRALTSVMPADAARLVGDQLMNVVRTSGEKKGLGLLLALGLAVFGARNAAGSIVTALNVAYEEKEKRGFVMVNLLALGMTAAGVAVAVIAAVAIAALGHLEQLLPTAPGPIVIVGKLVSYLALGLAGAAGAATLYRYGPSRERPRWMWLTPGSVFTAVMWLALTLGFGIYVANFGNYNATYGSLGAVVVLLTWLYLSSYVLLFGAEINSEVEHQTAVDTTVGAARPMGRRGAWAADHVAGGAGPREASPPWAGPESPGSGSGPIDGEVPGQRALVADYAAARTAARLSRSLGLKRLGLLTSACATIGLSLLGRRGRVPHGAALLVAAAALSLLAREKDETDPLKDSA